VKQIEDAAGYVDDKTIHLSRRRTLQIVAERREQDASAFALFSTKRLKLIIVDSFEEQENLKSILSNENGFLIYSTGGCIRQLDSTRSLVPPDYTPKYLVKKPDLVKRLKAETEKADEVILATSSGGSGEANAWHLKVVLDLKNFRRVRLDGVQGTLTASKIVEAIVLRHSEKIVERFVKSHEARLVIDHLVYFCVSDWLSKYFRNKIFIGRLQALAIQEIVQREREIQGLRSSTTTKTPSRFNRSELLSELKYKGRWGTSDKAAESAIGSSYFTEDGDGKLIPTEFAFEMVDALSAHFSFMRLDYIRAMGGKIEKLHYELEGSSYKSVVADFDNLLTSELGKMNARN
jgi:DNA topoisomerase IA